MQRSRDREEARARANRAAQAMAMRARPPPVVHAEHGAHEVAQRVVAKVRGDVTDAQTLAGSQRHRGRVRQARQAQALRHAQAVLQGRVEGSGCRLMRQRPGLAGLRGGGGGEGGATRGGRAGTAARASLQQGATRAGRSAAPT